MITLPYKYYPFARKVVTESKPVYEARGSDDGDWQPAKPEDASESSFPVSSYILKSWQYQDKKFKKNLGKSVVMPKAGESEKKEDQSNKDKDPFSIYCSSFASILTSKPEKSKWFPLQ